MTTHFEKPIVLLQDQPRWPNPLAEELNLRGIPYVLQGNRYYDPAERSFAHSLVFNQLPPHTSHRKTAHESHYLEYLEQLGVPVINGYKASLISGTRSRQLSLFANHDFPFPVTRIVSSAFHLLEAALELSFPLIVKSNLVGKFATLRVDALSDLQLAIIEGKIVISPEAPVILQEYIPPKNNSVVRVETVNGRYTFAMKFNQLHEEEVFTPSLEVINAAEKIARTALIDVGSVEYAIDRRSNKLYFLSIAAFRHYSTGSHAVFNPYGMLTDYIERRLLKAKEISLTL